MIVKLITNEGYGEPLEKIDKSIFSNILVGKNINRETIKTFVADADVLMLASESVMPFDKELIDAGNNIKFISLDTTDYSWIDVDYAKSKGIVVCNSPHVSTEAVAEHTLAMILNFYKRIDLAYRDLYLNNGNMKLVLGEELLGKTAGIIGFGDIGQRVAVILQALGMKVIFWNRSKVDSSSCKQVEINELLGSSDVISINLSANSETKKFINLDKIALVKPGALLVNLADKSLVDEDVVYQALLSKKLAGYCVELWDIKERKEHKLYEMENVIALNGFGWYTRESLERTFNMWYANVTNFLKGKTKNSIT